MRKLTPQEFKERTNLPLDATVDVDLSSVSSADVDAGVVLSTIEAGQGVKVSSVITDQAGGIPIYIDLLWDELVLNNTKILRDG